MIQYLNVFFTISTRTFVRRCFSSAAGCATTTASTPGAPPQVKCSITRGMVISVESVPYRHFGDFLRAPVRHVNAALDVRVVFASGSETTHGDGARRYCGVLTLIGGAGLLWRRLTISACVPLPLRRISSS